jgi:uncharacterized protein
MKNQISIIKRKIIPILKRNKIAKAGIFGSYARGEQKKRSDIDIVIKVKSGEKFSLFDLSGLKIELEEKLKKKVDINTYRALHPELKNQILKEEVKIL